MCRGNAICFILKPGHVNRPSRNTYNNDNVRYTGRFYRRIKPIDLRIFVSVSAAIACLEIIYRIKISNYYYLLQPARYTIITTRRIGLLRPDVYVCWGTIDQNAAPLFVRTVFFSRTIFPLLLPEIYRGS